MTELRERARAWLDRLRADAPRARDRADGGDPGPLAALVSRAQSEARARVLSDAAARADVAAEDADLARALEPWLTHDFAAEARWRSRLAHTVRTVDEQSATLFDLERWLESDDPDVRAAGSRSWSSIWRRAVTDAQRWRPKTEGAGSTDPDPPREPSSSGLIVAPSAEIVAALATTGVLEPHQWAPPSTTATDAPSTATLEGLVRELAAATDQPLTSFGGWRRASVGTAVADFTPDAPLAGGPAWRAGRPLARGARRCIGPAHEGRWLFLGTLLEDAAHADARAMAWVSAENLRRGLRSPPSDTLRAVRGLALAIGAWALESAWSRAGTADAWEDGFARVGAGTPPRAWAEMAELEASLTGLPGEGAAVYARHPALFQRLCLGARRARELREEFDVDWPFDPARRDVEGPRIEAPATASDLTNWLVEAARL